MTGTPTDMGHGVVTGFGVYVDPTARRTTPQRDQHTITLDEFVVQVVEKTLEADAGVAADQNSKPAWGPKWEEKVRTNLVPLSKAKSTKEAISEWFYTGEHKRHDDATEICHLCGQHGLKYHFEIENKHTANALMVGSECIKRFEIQGADAVVADHKRMEKERRDRKAVHFLDFIRINSINRPDREPYDLQRYYRKKGYITLKQAVACAEIVHRTMYAPPAHPPISVLVTRKNLIEGINGIDLGLVWPYLSASQQKSFGDQKRIDTPPVRTIPFPVMIEPVLEPTAVVDTDPKTDPWTDSTETDPCAEKQLEESVTQNPPHHEDLVSAAELGFNTITALKNQGLLKDQEYEKWRQDILATVQASIMARLSQTASQK